MLFKVKQKAFCIIFKELLVAKKFFKPKSAYLNRVCLIESAPCNAPFCYATFRGAIPVSI